MSQPPPSPIPSVDVREADRRRGEGALVVDVRERNEFETVRLEDGVALIPMSEFGARFAELPKDRPLLIMCAAGSRSAAATAHLLRNGWSDVVNVAGGITDWERNGLPVRHGQIEPDEGTLQG